MMDFSSFVIPLLLAFISAWALREKINVYEAFTDGAAEGLRVLLRIFPHLLVLLTAIAMFRASGGLDLLTQWLQPILEAVGIPSETAALVLLRPFSGSGGLAI
ncbi:MAG: spore maturation protein, partial [Oscillospiraceae bacterium]|nr:spore maturation protein [Oscillospiraceae bacterium]